MTDPRRVDIAPDSEESGLQLRLDWRVLLLELRRWSWALAVIFLILMLSAAMFLTYRNRHSMERWSASAKLFHQTRSDRIPSFYKQLDTKAIAEFTGSVVQLRKVAERLNLPPGDAANLSERLNLTIPKTAPDIIIITATYNDAKMAAELANKVAEVGVEAYIELQNSTLKDMLAERHRRRLVLNSELQKQEQELNGYLAPESSLPPDEELIRLRTQISADLESQQNNENEAKRLDVIIAETVKELNSVERQVPYLQRTHNAAGAELGKMNSDLTALEQKYTADNPRVRAFQDEVNEKRAVLEAMANEKPTPDEIVYMVNQVGLTLEENLLRNRIEQAGLKVRIEQSKKDIESMQAQVNQQLAQVTSYNETKRRIEATKTSLTQLDNSINDTDLLLNSAVPDLSVMEQAATPQVPQGGGIKIVIFSFAIGLFGAIATGAGLLGWSIWFGRIKCSREFPLFGNFDDLGALPVAGVGSQNQLNLEAALQRTFMNVREHLGDGKILLIADLSPNPDTVELTRRWTENFGVNGLQVFRLKCAPYTTRETTVFPSVSKRQPVDHDLICIEKYGARGWFFANNEQVLAPAELGLLQNDLKTLGTAYDVVIIERDTPLGTGGDTMFEQLCRLADYTVITAIFDVDRKVQLCRLGANEALRDRHIGGILTSVEKNFWSIQSS